ncbi:LysR family transcriptional regulator [Staphylococcus schleiferi]|uniref:LysR substrate-binding domain-containing protein n=1 Tax=Staphylococcus schleiferi TaxID=1295 RepID=UPI002480C4AC|nr:LysR family transcriptional regulator [Staphylococcus schleiferi]
MKEQDYKILSLLHQEKNLTRVAEKLFISQPALTYRVKKIEQEFGISLTKKFGKNIEFTPEGEYLIQFSNKILHDIQNLKNSISEIKSSIPNSFKLGANHDFIKYHLPFILKGFLSIEPNLKMNIDSGWSSEVMQKLENNELDVAIITGDYQWCGKKIFLKKGPITLISSRPINLDSLPEIPRINYKPQKNYKAYVELEYSITKLINDWWQSRYNVEGNIVIESDKVELCKKLVQEQMGYSIIPYTCIDKNEEFYQYNLVDRKGRELYRKTWLFYRESAKENNHVHNFIEYCENYFC